MDYEKEYKGALARCKWLLSEGMISKIAATDIFRELMDNDSENIRKEIINIFHSLADGKIPFPINFADIFTWLEKQKPIQNINKEDEEVRQYIIRIMKQRDINVPMVQKALTWLEKQELKSNPYSGVSFSYNGNTWGMCARDNGVDILFNKKLIQHISDEKQGEKKLPIEKLPSEMKTIGESFGFTTQEECDDYNKMVTDLIMSDDNDKQKLVLDEEDEHKIKLLEALCEDKLFESVPNSTMYEEMKITIDWLKSLKQRIRGKL